MKISALIPARGNSKRIKHKNLVQINSLPLIYYTIDAAKNSMVDSIWVSTDDNKIKEISLSFGANVIDRPEELAEDNTTTEEVIHHFFQKVSCDAIVLIQATSPMVLSEDINKGINTFLSGEYDSVFSACEPEDMLLWDKNNNTPINYDLYDRMNISKRMSILIETGAFYIFTRDCFLQNSCRLGGKIGYVLQDYWKSFEIDVMDDLKNIRKLMKD